MDKATRKICKAISLGVFFRAAPSTIAIILSRKLSPASLVTLTTIQSDSTVVPPVTALRSPPASRITGADSPVMALSSTDAAPSMTSPSAGICSPALTITSSPFFSRADGTTVTLSFCDTEGILCASTSFRDARRESACALPRPSAMASAKLANSTVNQRIMAIASVYPLGASFNPNRDTTQRILVKIADTKTRNMTGFFACVFGLNFAKESLIALPSIFRSAKALFCFVHISVNLLYAMLPKNSASGPRASAGKKLSAPISNTTTISRKTNIPFVVDKVPAVVAIFFFPARLPAIASVPMMGRNRAKSITSPRLTFRNTVFALKPAKAEPLLPPQDE